MNDEAKNKVIQHMAEIDPSLASKYADKASGFMDAFMRTVQVIKGDKGDKGDTPEYKKDYLTEEELSQIKKELTPVKGEHYFTLSEIQDFLTAATPRKGEHYFDGAKGEPGKDGYTPVKGVDYFDGKPGEKGDKGDPGKDGKDATVEDVVKALRNLKGNDRLDITHLRNGEQIAMALGKLQKLDMSDLRWHGGGLVTIQNAGTQVTNKATVLNFTGTGISSITELNGVVTVNISGGSGGGITSINADTTAAQVLDVGTAGTDFAISDNGTGTHTFNLPTASATKRGALSSADWTTFNNKFTLPSLTSGSVLFFNGSTIAQDNANFFWDDTNNRLGIGTASPGAQLHVVASASNVIGEIIRGTVSQSSNLTEWQNSAGVAVAAINADGSKMLLTKSATGGIAVGDNVTLATGPSSLAIGAFSRATADQSAAIGSYNVVASGIGSFAFGNTCFATGLFDIAMGYGTTAAGGSSVAIGRSATTSGGSSTAIGYAATAGAGQLAIAANGAVRIFADSSGKVGIGTTSPAAKLDVSGSILGQRLVEANTAGSGSPNIITAGESRTLYTNEGATALNYHTLPTAAAGLTYTFYVQDTDGIRVVANTGDDILINGVSSTVAGYCQSTVIGSSVTLTAINATDWVATSVVGTWTLA